MSLHGEILLSRLFSSTSINDNCVDTSLKQSKKDFSELSTFCNNVTCLVNLFLIINSCYFRVTLNKELL